MGVQYEYIYYDDPISESKRRKRRSKRTNPYSKVKILNHYAESVVQMADLGKPEWATEDLKRSFSVLYCMRISKEQKKILNAKYGEIVIVFVASSVGVLTLRA
ncbi:hypothetical protein F5877DRAFT_65338 [Lentinula edodes]|nr:hypothetical protein F5877DRAFT_65338 [Lentinula edodes]